MLDITTTPMEIAPTAHYSMGGVWVRPTDHGTGVEGRFLQRGIRNTMTEHAGVVRDENGLTAGLREVAEIDDVRRASAFTRTSPDTTTLRTPSTSDR